MPITLEITPELEEVLLRSAQRAGLPLDGYVLQVLPERLGGEEQLPPHLSREETELLQQISQGLPPETWVRYQALKEKRDVRTRTPDEHAELLALTDEVELWNAPRLELVLALAQLRQVRLRDMVDELGLAAPHYAWPPAAPAPHSRTCPPHSVPGMRLMQGAAAERLTPGAPALFAGGHIGQPLTNSRPLLGGYGKVGSACETQDSHIPKSWVSLKIGLQEWSLQENPVVANSHTGFCAEPI